MLTFAGDAPAVTRATPTVVTDRSDGALTFAGDTPAMTRATATAVRDRSDDGTPAPAAQVASTLLIAPTYLRRLCESQIARELSGPSPRQSPNATHIRIQTEKGGNRKKIEEMGRNGKKWEKTGSNMKKQEKRKETEKKQDNTGRK